MNERATLKARLGWYRWYRWALPVYWVSLFCATHIPVPPVDLPVRSSDKIAHFVAYGLLGFLFWRFGETFSRPLSARFVWLAALWIGLYGAVDEWLQPFVGRSGDVLDWVYDVAGAGVVLAGLEWRRRRLARREGKETVDSRSEGR